MPQKTCDELLEDLAGFLASILSKRDVRLWARLDSEGRKEKARAILTANAGNAELDGHLKGLCKPGGTDNDPVRVGGVAEALTRAPKHLVATRTVPAVSGLAETVA